MWYGLEIKDKFNINGVIILIGNDFIVILCPSSHTSNNLFNFYNVFKHYLKETRIKEIFGLWHDRSFDLIRQKLKKSLIGNFTEETLIFLLEGDNQDAYYIKKNNLQSFLGLEIRFSSEKTFLKESEIISLVREIGMSKKKLLYETRKL